MAKTKGVAPSDTEIDKILERFFCEEELTEVEAQEALVRLKPVSGKVVARLLPRVTGPDPEARAVACHLLGELGDRSAVRPLRRIAGDPTLDDEIRIEVFGLLADMGETLDQDEFAGSLRDPDAAMRRMLERGVTRWQNLERLSAWVATVQERLSPDIQAAYIADVAALEDDRALLFILAMAQSEHEEVVLAALDALDRLGNPLALSDVRDLADYHMTARVRDRARQVGERLAGRLPQTAPPPALPPPGPCLLTIIDGDGGQIAFVARQNPDGRLALVHVVFDDHDGVKDAMGGAHAAEAQLTELLDELEDEGIVPVEVGLTRVQDAVEAARQLTLKIGRRLPPDFVIWRYLLSGPDPSPRPAPRLPEVDLAAQPELLDGAYELMGLDEFDSWLFSPNELRGLDERARRLKRDAHFAGRLGQLVRDAIPAIVPPTKRRVIRDRLLRQAQLLTEIYKERPEVTRWAVAAAEGLADNSPISPQDHPLLQEMVLRGLENALARPLRAED